MDFEEEMECDEFTKVQDQAKTIYPSAQASHISSAQSGNEGAFISNTDEIKLKFNMLSLSNSPSNIDVVHDGNDMECEIDSQAILQINEIDKKKEYLTQLYQEQFDDYKAKLYGLSKKTKIEHCNNYMKF